MSNGPSPFRRRAGRGGALTAGTLCLALLRPAPGLGVDYTAQASAALQQNYNTNLQLQPASLNPQGIWGSEVDVKTSFSAAAPTWTAGVTGRFDNWFYYPVAGLDMQNQYVDGSLSHLTERSRSSLAVSFVSDALLSSQTDPTQTQGVILGRVPRELIRVSPSWLYKLDEYTSVNLGYSYDEASYPGGAAGQSGFYPDSTTHSASASASRQAAERLSLDGSLSFTDYSTSQSSIKYVNFMAGAAYTPDERTHLSVQGGGQYTQTTSSFRQLAQQIDQLGPVFSASASREFEYSTLSISYSRSITPSINGNLFTSDRASLTATRRLLEKLDGNLRLVYSGSSYPPQSGVAAVQTPTQNQSILQVAGELSYALAKNCALNASYSYQVRDFGVATGPYAVDQEAHAVSLSLRYDFEPLHY